MQSKAIEVPKVFQAVKDAGLLNHEEAGHLPGGSLDMFSESKQVGEQEAYYLTSHNGHDEYSEYGYIKDDARGHAVAANVDPLTRIVTKVRVNYKDSSLMHEVWVQEGMAFGTSSVPTNEGSKVCNQEVLDSARISEIYVAGVAAFNRAVRDLGLEERLGGINVAAKHYKDA